MRSPSAPSGAARGGAAARSGANRGKTRLSPLRESCRPQEPPTGITSANATLRGIFKVRPIHAFDAQLTSASVIFGASMVGAPVSTTHVVSSALMGIGASERPKAVRWAKAKEIVSTWVITIPGAGAVSVATYLLVNSGLGVGSA